MEEITECISFCEKNFDKIIAIAMQSHDDNKDTFVYLNLDTLEFGSDQDQDQEKQIEVFFVFSGEFEAIWSKEELQASLVELLPKELYKEFEKLNCPEFDFDEFRKEKGLGLWELEKKYFQKNSAFWRKDFLPCVITQSYSQLEFRRIQKLVDKFFGACFCCESLQIEILDEYLNSFAPNFFSESEISSFNPGLLKEEKIRVWNDDFESFVPKEILLNFLLSLQEGEKENFEKFQNFLYD